MSNSTKVARSRVLLGAAVAALAVVVACEARVPTSAEVQAMDVRGAEQATGIKTAMPDMANARYYIDGVRSTAEQAHALPADQIASMGVQHLGVNGPPVAVYIQTTGATLVAAKEAAAATSGLRELHTKIHTALSRGGDLSTASEKRDDGIAFGSEKFTGLVFVDGVRSDLTALKTLGPNRIASVEVLKSAAAIKEYSDPAAKNGVLRIFTKK